ncbi:Aryl-alcohol dehydrogenase [Sporomusa silvacetica DSM 10669]|uniref:Aryl-alcohol dehydrogenase n=1 Tax=Sporomusa silvacetica DSM 10669 TaxID=1123289 RepID=A0ABZ3IKV5_9FIRM|nr:NAD(P)-dependent alcohol dehydrogenase [Sporomusa silvacetica]OZC22745.1 aryl-alcohol dehydrogenase [Sporomusa silvacetica DSM 10669]
MKVNAAVTYQKGTFTLDEVELDDVKSNEVLVKIVACGVCHTDVVARDQDYPFPLPGILGHEGSGIVEKVGENVRDLKKGDHVVLSYAVCGHCDNCLTAHPGGCEHMDDLNFQGKLEDGTTRLHKGEQPISLFFGQSSFATYAVANEKNVIKVDPDVDISILGPLGCGIATGSGTVLNALKPGVGSTIAVYGTGAVGLSALMAAKIAGCTKIIAVDVFDNRLELAKEVGATHVVNSKRSDVVEEIRKITNNKGTTYAIETTGVPEVFMNALHALGTRGTLAQVAVSRGPVTLELNMDVMWNSKTIVGVIEGDAVSKIFIPQLVEYYKAGQFPFDKLVKFYDFKDIDQAFEDSKIGVTIKPVLRMPQ